MQFPSWVSFLFKAERESLFALVFPSPRVRLRLWCGLRLYVYWRWVFHIAGMSMLVNQHVYWNSLEPLPSSSTHSLMRLSCFPLSDVFLPGSLFYSVSAHLHDKRATDCHRGALHACA